MDTILSERVMPSDSKRGPEPRRSNAGETIVKPGEHGSGNSAVNERVARPDEHLSQASSAAVPGIDRRHALEERLPVPRPHQVREGDDEQSGAPENAACQSESLDVERHGHPP